MNVFEKHLIGRSAALNRARNTASLIAPMDVTVLIVGESGTGKECFAESIHATSHRADKPFVTLNCAAIPDNLFEAELFGYRKGAFTGADKNSQGHILAAHGGTLFLDEVGELSMSAQGKLLRFLESQQIQPLGSTSHSKVDVRVLAATNQPLMDRVTSGDFREDLYYRLNVVPMEVPSLRDRREDVPALLDHFLNRCAERHELSPVTITPAARRVLKAHSWPGNVRELRNLCERMTILFQSGEVDVDQLPAEIRQPVQSSKPGAFVLPPEGIDLNALEASVLEQALSMASGNRSAAARLLGISRDTFLYRLQKFAIGS